VLGADPAAEDAAQEATFRAWRYSTQCRSPDHPIAWLATIARREALRIASTGGELLLSEPRRDQAAPEASAPLSADVREALRALAPIDRRLILARYWGDWTQAAVAEQFGLPEGTAKVRLHRAKSRLRALLSDR
jgi:RNA polymerase sigma-70 factor (ECF subfamily)